MTVEDEEHEVFTVSDALNGQDFGSSDREGFGRRCRVLVDIFLELEPELHENVLVLRVVVQHVQNPRFKPHDLNLLHGELRLGVLTSHHVYDFWMARLHHVERLEGLENQRGSKFLRFLLVKRLFR